MNIARWFSYTLEVERERDEWKQKAQEWQNYALVSRGMPVVTPEPRPQVSRPAPPPRRSIQAMRQQAQRIWAGRPEPNGLESMEQAADEYAARIKAG